MGTDVSKPGNGTANGVMIHGHGGEIKRILADASLLGGYRTILNSLDVPDVNARPFKIAVTETLYDEGAPSVALGLATTLASVVTGQVILVDLDLSRPTLNRRLDAPGSPGVSEVLANQARLAAALQPMPLPNLVFLPGGDRRQYGARAAAGLRTWLGSLEQSEESDFLVLSLPPLNVDIGAQMLAAVADAVVLVVLGEVTPRTEVQLALTQLAHCKLASVVVNHQRPTGPSLFGHLVRFVTRARG